MKLIWSDLRYLVINRWYDVFEGYHIEDQLRLILMSQSGQIVSGQMTALMGPSGAGKTTLLNCVTARITDGVSGQIVVRFDEPRVEGIRIGFVPQNDHLFDHFTVRETLLFALRMNQRKSESRSERNNKVEQILKVLDLLHEAKTKVRKLSGGQVKRTSIAAELISSPEMLILDEPTSGLDWDNSEKVVTLLANLCQRLDIAICATIHQPSFQLLNKFDMVYILNKYGSCIYFDKPSQLIPTITSFGFEAPPYVNPADLAIEIANARFGEDAFVAMSIKAKDQALQVLPDDIPIGSLKPRIAAPFCKQKCLLFTRYLTSQVCKSSFFIIKLVVELAIMFCICGIFNQPPGYEDGCWSTLITNVTREQYEDKLKVLNSNISIIFMATMFYSFLPCTMAVLGVSKELITIRKENSNSWYSFSAYFLSRTLADLFLTTLTNAPSIIYLYIGSKQIFTWNRLMVFTLTLTIYCNIWDSKGVILGTIFSPNYVTGMIFAMLLEFPAMFLSGFHVKQSGLFWLLKPLAPLSEGKWAYEAMVISIYGFDRCPVNTTSLVNQASFFDFGRMNRVDVVLRLWPKLNSTIQERHEYAQSRNLSYDCIDSLFESINREYIDSGLYAVEEEVEKEPSYILSLWDLNQDDLEKDLLILTSMYIAFRFMVYIVLIFKGRHKRI